jgi:Domain of unknown function (DUF4145)
MPGHGNIIHFMGNAPNSSAANVADANATRTMICPHCGNSVMAAVIAQTHAEAPAVAWLRCASCNSGAVDNNGRLWPSPMVGEAVDGLPAEVAAAYEEARKTAGVGAYTSCELMCRKILMHIAVDKGASEGENFITYLDFLKTSGYITPPMVPWVDLIRTHGNASTHRLQAASEERAMNTLSFTSQLLRLVYEMEHRALRYVGPTPTA